MYPATVAWSGQYAAGMESTLAQNKRNLKLIGWEANNVLDERLLQLPYFRSSKFVTRTR